MSVWGQPTVRHAVDNIPSESMFSFSLNIMLNNSQDPALIWAFWLTLSFSLFIQFSKNREPCHIPTEAKAAFKLWNAQGPSHPAEMPACSVFADLYPAQRITNFNSWFLCWDCLPELRGKKTSGKTEVNHWREWEKYYKQIKDLDMCCREYKREKLKLNSKVTNRTASFLIA